MAHPCDGLAVTAMSQFQQLFGRNAGIILQVSPALLAGKKVAPYDAADCLKLRLYGWLMQTPPGGTPPSDVASRAIVTAAGPQLHTFAAGGAPVRVTVVANRFALIEGAKGWLDGFLGEWLDALPGPAETMSVWDAAAAAVIMVRQLTTKPPGGMPRPMTVNRQPQPPTINQPSS